MTIITYRMLRFDTDKCGKCDKRTCKTVARFSLRLSLRFVAYIAVAAVCCIVASFDGEEIRRYFSPQSRPVPPTMCDVNLPSSVTPTDICKCDADTKYCYNANSNTAGDYFFTYNCEENPSCVASIAAANAKNELHNGNCLTQCKNRVPSPEAYAFCTNPQTSDCQKDARCMYHCMQWYDVGRNHAKDVYNTIEADCASTFMPYSTNKFIDCLATVKQHPRCGMNFTDFTACQQTHQLSCATSCVVLKGEDKTRYQACIDDCAITASIYLCEPQYCTNCLGDSIENSEARHDAEQCNKHYAEQAQNSCKTLRSNAVLHATCINSFVDRFDHHVCKPLYCGDL